jgi:hypothetical protein
LEDPIPPITIETNYPNNNATTDTPVTFIAKRESGNIAPSQLSYYWDFGCGHQQFGGPEISHSYSMNGSMDVSVVINSPNFVDTVALDNPLSISYSIDDPESPAAPAPSSPLDGKIIKWDGDASIQGTPQKWSGQAATINSRWYVQSGHRRWVTSAYNMNLLRDIRGLEEDADIELYTNLINNIPVGPQIGGSQLTGESPGLNEPITDGYMLGSLGTTGGDDSGDDSDDDSGDDSDDATFYTLNILIKYDTSPGPSSYNPVSLPYTIVMEGGEPDHVVDGLITIDGVDSGRNYSESFLEGTVINIEILDDSYPEDNYEFVEWLDSPADATRTVVMTQDINITAVLGIAM